MSEGLKVPAVRIQAVKRLFRSLESYSNRLEARGAGRIVATGVTRGLVRIAHKWRPEGLAVR